MEKKLEKRFLKWEMMLLVRVFTFIRRMSSELNSLSILRKRLLRSSTTHQECVEFMTTLWRNLLSNPHHARTFRRLKGLFLSDTLHFYSSLLISRYHKRFFFFFFKRNSKISSLGFNIVNHNIVILVSVFKAKQKLHLEPK